MLHTFGDLAFFLPENLQPKMHHDIDDIQAEMDKLRIKVTKEKNQLRNDVNANLEVLKAWSIKSESLGKTLLDQIAQAKKQKYKAP